MKLTSILLLVTALQVSARSGAQTITYSAKETKLEKVFAAIKKQTGYVFFYREEDLSGAEPVSVSFSNTPLETALQEILKNQQLKYNIQGRAIFITKAEKPAIEKKDELPQDPPVDLKGRITDIDGNSLGGANIRIKGTATGVTADNDGFFTLRNVERNATLEISFIGYVTREVKLTAASFTKSLTFQLVPSSGELNEVVINKGYYSEKQKLSTGNVGRITSKDIERAPVINALQAMQGRIPGLHIAQESGLPGAGFKVQIRGTNSIANGNDPLYVIDGVPITAEMPVGSNTVSTTPLNGVPSMLNLINPSDIETIEVLKDADATAIYGSRGANGVILITTKKGRPGRSNFNVNVNRGIGKVANFIDLMNKEEYLEYRRITFETANRTPGPLDSDLNGAWGDQPYTNWQDILIGGSAQYTDATLSLTGGSQQTTYRLQGGYNKQTTVYPGDYGNKRYSMHFALANSSLNNRLRMQFSASYAASDNDMPYADMANRIAYYPITPKIYDENGNFNWQNDTWYNTMTYFVVKTKQQSNNLVGNLLLTYNIMQGLKITASGSYNITHFNDLQAMPVTYYRPALGYTTGNTTFGFNTSNLWNIEPQISYNRKLFKGTFDVTVGSTILESERQNNVIFAEGYPDDKLLESMGAATTLTKRGANYAIYKYNSIYGRINYNWDDKYVVNATARRDGSSRFGPGKQFGNFGAVGLAWLFSNENWFKRALPFINYGKLRASYGTSGNDQIADYRFFDLYTFTNWQTLYQQTQGLFPANLFNDQLAWELNKKAEVGLELGLFNDRVAFSASFFRNRSSNQLVSLPLPGFTGFTSIPANMPAVVQNKGWEFSLSTANYRNKNFSWRSSFNITFISNELVSYPGIEFSTYVFTKRVGEPVLGTHVFDYVRVDPQTGLHTFRTAAGDTTHMVVSTRDKTKSRDLEPDFYGGFQNTITWKSFELDFVFTFKKRMDQNVLTMGLQAPGYFTRFGILNWHKDILNAWQKPGDITNVQRLSPLLGTESNVYTNLGASTYNYVDASYIRLQNVSLSYQLPPSVNRILKLQSSKVYMQAQNLLTITSYKGLDPETGVNVHPPLRMITAGIQLTF